MATDYCRVTGPVMGACGNQSSGLGVCRRVPIPQETASCLINTPRQSSLPPGRARTFRAASPTPLRCRPLNRSVRQADSALACSSPWCLSSWPCLPQRFSVLTAALLYPQQPASPSRTTQQPRQRHLTRQRQPQPRPQLQRPQQRHQLKCQRLQQPRLQQWLLTQLHLQHRQRPLLQLQRLRLPQPSLTPQPLRCQRRHQLTLRYLPNRNCTYTFLITASSGHPLVPALCLSGDPSC